MIQVNPIAEKSKRNIHDINLYKLSVNFIISRVSRLYYHKSLIKVSLEIYDVPMKFACKLIHGWPVHS